MVVIVAVYSKKIGLPAYSSHSYSVSLTSEVADLSAVERESAKLYSILQQSVDREMQEPGYVPEANGHGSTPHTNGHANQSNGDQWACSDKQRDLILKIVDEHKLDKQEIENLSKDMFNAPVKTLNRMDASSLIAELIAAFFLMEKEVGLSRIGVYQRVKRMASRAEITHPITPHGLRATGACWMAQAGYSVTGLMAHFGWSEIKTAQHYIEATGASAMRDMNELGARVI